MSLARVSSYISNAPSDPAGIWQQPELEKWSTSPPEDMTARHETILRADAHALWFRWFIEGICNPLRYVDDEKKTIIDVLSDVIPRVDEIYPKEPADERSQVAKKIATHIMAEVSRRRQIERVSASIHQKRELIDSSAEEPRCWMCGYRFSERAIEKFLGKTRGLTLDPPQFVDILRPRGIYVRDIGIEVEHIVPVAGGGGGLENLALACGWCNKSKGARTSLYDADARAPRASYVLGNIRWHELPHPFWTVRLMATRMRCEHSSGCDRNIKNSELFIAPSDHRGAPNPSNLHIYCAEHDPYHLSRFFPREEAARIWKEKTRAFA
ncbi:MULTISPECIES: HNH endonuclease [Pseudomonas]|uniref:HNH endonuclease n=1 Tax=Pseudomonas TaxID=286 RepID=UPI0019133037|nr:MULTISPECIES: HNH endonuclease [Pseudomonas]MCS7977430.1 HNH endonuclease [Pseudomonas aeruginosa]MCS9132467.1 HNH endonuclease [Pseudomonas aeruginosa]MCS9207451.1 HNH endonuclease [Pseudomonas aeruginosa]HCG0941932.1 HNH endonuclease [Pseudomonas aeruginosa]HCW0222334.1 HNH endonuclease [Pseudomonas aeruginosa]